MNSATPTTHDPLNAVATIADYGRFALHVILPTAIGAMIYVLFRTTSLVVFDWLDAIRLLQFTLHLRQLCSEIVLPDWNGTAACRRRTYGTRGQQWKARISGAIGLQIQGETRGDSQVVIEGTGAHGDRRQA
jgi:hypothetical protein